MNKPVRVVVFTSDNARVLEGQDPAKYQGRQDCLIDPKIPQGVPPHHWKLSKGQLVEMTDEEKSQRNLIHSLPEITSKHPRKTPIKTPKRAKAIIISIILITCILLVFKLTH